MTKLDSRANIIFSHLLKSSTVVIPIKNSNNLPKKKPSNNLLTNKKGPKLH